MQNPERFSAAPSSSSDSVGFDRLTCPFSTAVDRTPRSAPRPITFGGIILVALVGAFLPVPMAFDVVIAYVAMARGVPLPYVVTILCTLGIVSVYSLSVVAKSISWKIAGAAYTTVAAVGVIAGLIARSIR